MNEVEVYDKLVDDNVAGGRIHRGIASNVVYPYIRFTVNKTPLTQDLVSNSSWRNTFYFQIFAQTFSDAKQAQIELRNSLALVGREVTYSEDDAPDPDTGSIRIINDWIVDEFT